MAGRGASELMRTYTVDGSTFNVNFMLSITTEGRDAIMHGENSAVIRDIGIKQGMVTLKEGGLHRVRDGISSLQAVLEVTGGE